MVEIVVITVIGLIVVITGVTLKNNTNFKATYRAITDRVHTGSTRWQKFLLMFITPTKWEACSAKHDLDYDLGLNRKNADVAYLKCMIKAHVWLTPIALLYFLAVRIAGDLYFRK